jgi:adenylosuccinate lyase
MIEKETNLSRRGLSTAVFRIIHPRITETVKMLWSLAVRTTTTASSSATTTVRATPTTTAASSAAT